MADPSFLDRAQQALPAAFLAGPYDPRPRLNALAGNLSRTIGIARALAQTGRAVDLTGIEDGVGMLCAKILDLPAGESRAMLPMLLDMRCQVEALLLILHASPDPPSPA